MCHQQNLMKEDAEQYLQFAERKELEIKMNKMGVKNLNK